MIALIVCKMRMSMTLLPPLSNELLFQHIGGKRRTHYEFLLIRYLGVGDARRNATFLQPRLTFRGEWVGTIGEGATQKQEPGQMGRCP